MSLSKNSLWSTGLNGMKNLFEWDIEYITKAILL